MRAINFLNERLRLVGAVTVAAACLYVVSQLANGWIAHDEGQLGQAAERTLLGELPHRDFDDMYTGGLSFLHALAFRWRGVDSASLREALALFFVPTIAAYYYLASRLLPAFWAALLTMLAATVSLPAYSAPMPSWYNLYFAVIGTAALARYLETTRRRWLFVAGLCGGLSVIVKITGLYFIAAALLFLAFREQLLSEADGEAPAAEPRRFDWYSWLLSCGLIVFACLALAFVRSGRPAMNALHFAAPMIGLAGFLLVHERRRATAASAVRWRRMAGMLIPFGIGAAIPVVALILLYAARGALGDLYEGVLILPQRRVERGVYPLPPFETFLLAAPLAALLAYGLRPPGPARKTVEQVALGAMAVLLLASGTAWGFELSFSALRNLLPLLVIIALWMLVDGRDAQLTSDQRQFLFLAAASAAMVSLVQYPHAYGVYFLYVAPLVVLLAGYVVALQPFPPRRAAAGLTCFYLAFSVLQLNGSDVHRNVAWQPGRRTMTQLAIERCNLPVATADGDVYRELVKIIHQHSAPQAYILAGPDCPEVYFLSQRRNPSKVMYEFFRPAWLADRARLFEVLDQQDVKVVVVNLAPSFSPAMPTDLVDAIAARFSEQQAISTALPSPHAPVERFRVFWRD